MHGVKDGDSLKKWILLCIILPFKTNRVDLLYEMLHSVMLLLMTFVTNFFGLQTTTCLDIHGTTKGRRPLVIDATTDITLC